MCLVRASILRKCVGRVAIEIPRKLNTRGREQIFLHGFIPKTEEKGSRGKPERR